MDDAKRLTDTAMGPCIICNRQLLTTGLPLFIRVKVQRCGIDANEIRRHVGLAQSMAPGVEGLALAAIMGPGVKPVVVLDEYDEANVCHECAATRTVETLHLMLMASVDEKQEASVG